MVLAATHLSKFAPTNKLVARSKLGLPLDSHLIAFSGAELLNCGRNIDFLQAVAGHLRGNWQRARVETVFIGSGGIDIGLPMHEAPRIEDTAHLSLIYAAADVFALPSSEETTQSVILESLLSGTPVVTFPVRHARRLILHKDTGFITSSQEAIEFANGLVWALIAEENDHAHPRGLRCHLHAQSVVSSGLAEGAVIGQPATSDIQSAVGGTSLSQFAMPASQPDLSRSSVNGALSQSMKWSIIEAAFDEHEIAGLVRAENIGEVVTHQTALPSVVAFCEDEAVAIAPVRLDGDSLRFHLELPRRFLFDISEADFDLRVGIPSVSNDTTKVALPQRPLISAERLLQINRAGANNSPPRKEFGIILYSHTRTSSAMLVLESLKRQGVLKNVEIWMDGDQGKPTIRKKLEAAEAQFRAFGVERVVRHRGNLGFRKLILQSLIYMAEKYDRFIVLEDDCFPSRIAIEEFMRSLDRYADNTGVLTTYGHHFLVPAERPLCPRFQGWGWATWADKIKPFLSELVYLYSLREEEYIEWTNAQMTPEILAHLDCTEPRGASITLKKFFAWDETLALLAALVNMRHAPTENRCIYNFGAGEESTHFSNVDLYRKPPFNMISKSEVWDYF